MQADNKMNPSPEPCHFCKKDYPSILHMTVWYNAPLQSKWLACPNCREALEDYKSTFETTQLMDYQKAV